MKKTKLSININYNDFNRVYISLVESLNRIVLPDIVKNRIKSKINILIKNYFINKATSIAIDFPIEGTVVYTKDGSRNSFSYSIIPGIDSWEVFIVKTSSEDRIKPFIGIQIDSKTGRSILCNRKDSGSLTLDIQNPNKKELTQYGLFDIAKDEVLPYSLEEKDFILKVFDESFVLRDALERNMPYRKDYNSISSGFSKSIESGFSMWYRFLEDEAFLKFIIDNNEAKVLFYRILDIENGIAYSKLINYSEFKALCPYFDFKKVKELIKTAKDNGVDCSNVSDVLIPRREKIKKD